MSQVVAGSDGDNDEDRARTAINGSRRIVVLGCTGGAGQTTTTLLLGHSLARLREDGVVAVDANSGGDGLTGRIVPETAETLSSFLTAVDSVGTRVRGCTTRTESGLDVLAADVDPGAEQRIGDRGWFSDQRIARAMRLLDQQYRIILMDPAAALAARLLPYADQLVLVAPASADAPDSVAMTYDWLDGHGCADLRRRAVVVINGVSRRSMADVERAETVARGRCRAIVRVPWEDELAEPGQVDLNDLRSGGRRASRCPCRGCRERIDHGQRGELRWLGRRGRAVAWRSDTSTTASSSPTPRPGPTSGCRRSATSSSPPRSASRSPTTSRSRWPRSG